MRNFVAQLRTAYVGCKHVQGLMSVSHLLKGTSQYVLISTLIITRSPEKGNFKEKITSKFPANLTLKMCITAEDLNCRSYKIALPEL